MVPYIAVLLKVNTQAKPNTTPGIAADVMEDKCKNLDTFDSVLADKYAVKNATTTPIPATVIAIITELQR